MGDNATPLSEIQPVGTPPSDQPEALPTPIVAETQDPRLGNPAPPADQTITPPTAAAEEPPVAELAALPSSPEAPPAAAEQRRSATPVFDYLSRRRYAGR